jgi:hypothetical protein
LPAESFYWGVLDTTPLKGRRVARQQLGYLFESMLPVSVDDVHCAFTPLQISEGRRHVACGMKHERLQQVMAERGAGLIAIRPEQIPQFVADGVNGQGDVILKALNLLTGPYQPPAIRMLHKRWIIQVAASLALCAVLVAIGAQRRVASIDRQIGRVNEQREALCEQVLGPSKSAQPSELRLTAELRTLRRTHQQPQHEVQQFDAALVLTSLLQHWPRELHLQTESLVVTPTRIAIRTSAQTSNDVQSLASALGPLETGGAWRLNQPQINSSRDGVNGVIQMRREGL